MKTQQQQANSIARKNGYGKATKIILGTENRVISHMPYGFETFSGKFFPHVTSTKYPWGGYYRPAETIVEVSRRDPV